MERVLVVDDDPDILSVVADVLRDEGCSVTTAANGEEALASLARPGRERPDLIITDLMMPQMDGWTLCEKLRDDPALADVPIAVLTAFADDHRKPIEMARVIKKPLNLNALVALLDAVR